MTDVKSQKKFLRQKIKNLRKQLEDIDVSKKSQLIEKNFFSSVDLSKVRNIHIYQSISNNHEVLTTNLINRLGALYPLLKITYPDPQIFTTGKDFDLVVVPIIAFDRSGNRLGYGGGYYDKFLAKNNCKNIIGLAYTFQEVALVPVEEHDQKIPIIITEKEIIKSAS